MKFIQIHKKQKGLTQDKNLRKRNQACQRVVEDGKELQTAFVKYDTESQESLSWKKEYLNEVYAKPQEDWKTRSGRPFNTKWAD